MRLNTRIAVIGSALRTPKTADAESLEELLFEVTQSALSDAGLTIEDIDGIVVASNDQMDGRAISVMAASGSVGGVGRDILSTPSAGEHAFVKGQRRNAGVETPCSPAIARAMALTPGALAAKAFACNA